MWLLVIDLPNSTNLFGVDWSQEFGLIEHGLSAIRGHSTNLICDKIPVQLNSKVQLLTRKYPTVLETGLGHCTKTKVSLYLRENAQPHFSKPREIAFSKRTAVKSELDRLEQEGVIIKLNISDWAAPIVCVTKPNGKIRICGDYKALNKQLHVDQHPIPKIDELMNKLRGGVHFSKIDLADAYLQLELDDEAKRLCVINTPFGLYQYQRMCFGVASSPAQFQRFIDSIVSDLPGVAAYLDDIIITGTDELSHWKNLEQLLARLQDHGLKVRLNKCEFFKGEVEYLGHTIDKLGKRPSPTAIKAIEQMPAPENLSQLQAFLGKVNYYGRFIENLSTKAAPLYALL